MSKQLLIDSLDESAKSSDWTYQDRADIPPEVLNESQSIVNDQIIGRVVGEMFAVNGRSGNKRFYSRALWETAIKKHASKLANGMLMGTIGHNQPIDEKAILEGKVSHRVSKLWIDESTNKGMGEILIMNTDAGRNLNALLKSGVKFPVSTRAFGDFKGKTDEGLDIVNPDTYELEGIDFVKNPGIASAIPSIVESLPSTENQMSDSTALTQITEEKIQLGRELKESKAANESIQGKLELAESRLETTKALLAKYESLGSTDTLKEITESFNEVNTAKLELEAQVASYRYLGSPEKIEEALEKSKAMVESYEELGTAAEIRECLGILESYVDVGSVQMIEAQVDELNAFREMGTVNTVSEALEGATRLIESYKDLGTLGELSQILDITESYAALGSPAEIQEALTRSLQFVEEAQAAKKKAQNEALATELGVPMTLIESLSDRSEDQIREIVGTITGRQEFTDRYRAGDAKKTVSESAKPLNENQGGQDQSSSRASRLAGRFNR